MPNPQLISDTEMSGLLKRLYDDLEADFFGLSTPLYASIKKSGPGGRHNMRWGGSNVYYNAKMGRATGATFSTSGYLPKDAKRTEQQGNIGITRLYVTRELDMLAIVGTTSKEAAYRSVAETAVVEMKDAFRLALQESSHGAGDGIKALIGSVGSTTSITVTSPYGVSGAGEGGLLLAVGMFVAVLDTSASDAVLGRATITAISNSGDNATLTLDTAITGMAAGDKVVGATASDTAYSATSGSVTANGLINITNRGGSYASHNGISATTYPETAPVRLVAGTDTPDADVPSEWDIWTLIRKVAAASGFDAGSSPNDFLVVTTVGLEKKLAQSFFGQREWAMAPRVTLNGGFSAVVINGVRVVSDGWCPAGTVYLIHLPSLTWVNAKDFAPVSYEGAGPWRFISGRDAYQTSNSQFFNLAAPQRNALGSITGYTDSERFSHVR